jgi:hypothetical protein
VAVHMLTTTDNPFDPFMQFDDWYAWDERAGYHTMSFLARVVRLADSLSDADEDQAYEDAMNEIVTENVQGNYRLVEGT